MSDQEFMQDCWYCNLSYSAYAEEAQNQGYKALTREEYNELTCRMGEMV